jgi:hypothetical protein
MSLQVKEDILKEFYKNLIEQFGENFLRKALENGSDHSSICSNNINDINDVNSDDNISNSSNSSLEDDVSNIRNYINILLFGNNLDFNVSKLFEFFESIESEKEYIIANNTIINNKMITGDITKMILTEISKHYEKYFKSCNKSEILLRLNNKYYKLFVDKHILDFSTEISWMLKTIFNNILQIADLDILLKGGALLYLLKTSTSKLSDKNFNFVDFDFVFNKKLKYSQKNNLKNFFDKNKIYKIGRYNFELKTIRHFNDLTANKFDDFKYTLFTFNLEYQNEKFRIDISDYHGVPDYHCNNILLNYTNNVPHIVLTKNQANELCNLIHDKPNVCPLMRYIIKQLSSSSNKEFVKNNLIGVLLRVNKSLLKGIKTKGFGKYEEDESCMLCFTGPSDKETCNNSDNYEIPVSQINSSQDIDNESKKYLRSLWIQLGCHPEHKICLCCLYNYSKSNLKFNCPCCRAEVSFNSDIDNNSIKDFNIFDKLWIRTIHNKQIVIPTINHYNILTLKDCTLIQCEKTPARKFSIADFNGINVATSFDDNSFESEDEEVSDPEESIQSDSEESYETNNSDDYNDDSDIDFTNTA